jgi:tetratricopeptide (TPR) repeat protein
VNNKIIILILTTLLNISANAQDIKTNSLLVINAYNHYNTPQKALDYYNNNNINYENNYKLKIAIATTHYLLGDYKTATNIYLDIDKKYIKHIYYQLAQCYALLNKPTISTNYLREYLQLKNKKMLREIKSDKAFVNIEQTQDWKELWREKEWYSKYDLLLEDAWYEYEQENYEETIKILDKLNSIRKSMIKAYYLKSLTYIKTNELKNALTSINTAINNRDNIAKYYELKASIENMLQKPGKALKTINYAIILDSTDIDYYFTRADIYLSNNKIDEAERDINILVTIVPNFKTYILAGDIYYAEKQYQDALKYYNKCIVLQKYNPNIYIKRGDTYQKIFAYEFAEKDYSMALDFTPYNGELYYKRGLSRKLQHKTNEACRDFNKAFKYKYMKADEEIRKICR